MSLARGNFLSSWSTPWGSHLAKCRINKTGEANVPTPGGLEEREEKAFAKSWLSVLEAFPSIEDREYSEAAQCHSNPVTECLSPIRNKCWHTWIKKWDADAPLPPPRAQMQITQSPWVACPVIWNASVNILIPSVNTNFPHWLFQEGWSY